MGQDWVETAGDLGANPHFARLHVARTDSFESNERRYTSMKVKVNVRAGLAVRLKK
jgi:hypothetical protein